jgi:hypothetical protein
MKKTTLNVMVALSVAGLQPVSAQDGDEPATYVYVTYFECNAGREYRADEIIERSFKPHYDAAVEAGEIVQWSWLAHFMGGKWRRALVLTTGNMDDLLAAAGALGEAIAELTPEAGRVFTEICPIHEDYIWQTVADIGETAATEQRGAVGFSTYMDCDINRQERADEIMRETIGAIYDARVANGDLTSWTWLTHIVGGQWRRLLSLTATDHNSMMRVRSEIVGELRTGRVQRAFNQLNEICTDHHDYLWDIQHETR